MFRRLTGFAFAVVLILALAIRPQPASAHELCFPADKTPHCFGDPFSDYWENNGGLPVFGYPITTAANEVNADTGQTYNTQWVERTRLEDHPENAGTPYRVLLGLLGKERLKQLGRDPNVEPRESVPKDGCLWFDQSGHNVCNIQGGLGFKAYWESHGLKIAGLDTYAQSLQLFGLPLTEPKTETNANGDTVLTQWFERARFEWHPGNPDEFKVLLGLLGREVRATTPLPPPTFNNCATDPTMAPNSPVKIISVAKAASPETVTIQFVSNATVDLTSWKLCSIRGNQLHATLSGTIAPGQSLDVPSQVGSSIWSNNDKDDASLYDADGRLISFWDDPAQ
jgi:hypothetical protein